MLPPFLPDDRAYIWIVTGPVTLLPAAWTGPESGGGRLPVLPVIVSGPTTRLPLNSIPPVFPISLTGPVNVLASHGPVAASPPMSTRPVVPVIVSEPVIVAPQMRTALAPVAVSGPVIRPPSISSDPPG